MKNYFRRYIIFLLLCICSVLIILVLLTRCKSLQQRYFKESRTDYLTGLATRQSFYENACKFFRDPKKVTLPLTVVFLDIDHFKKVNDTYGHDMGDTFLKILGKKIKSHMRASDIVARFGGDEFGILMQNTNKEDALSIINAIKLEFSSETEKIIKQPLNFSTGMVTFTKVPTIEKIFHRADFNLRKAKQELEGTIESEVQ